MSKSSTQIDNNKVQTVFKSREGQNEILNEMESIEIVCSFLNTEKSE